MNSSEHQNSFQLDILIYTCFHLIILFSKAHLLESFYLLTFKYVDIFVLVHLNSAALDMANKGHLLQKRQHPSACL